MVLILVNSHLNIFVIPASLLPSKLLSNNNNNNIQENDNNNNNNNNNGESQDETNKIVKSRVRGGVKNAVVEQLMKMQQQQTNKYNIRLKNLESSIRELKIKDTQRTELVHKLQEKLKNHDITLTKLSTKTVTGRKMMDTNNNNRRETTE